jgi:hypothetical protein
MHIFWSYHEIDKTETRNIILELWIDSINTRLFYPHSLEPFDITGG